mgnify:CR=1 FL=1
MLLAQRDWEDANIGHLRELLDRYRNRDDLKGFEWGYWNRLVNSDLFTLDGHLGAVYSMSFSPDGKRIVSGGIRDSAVKVWDAQTGQETLTLKGHTEVSCVSFSPDGSRIVSGGADFDSKGLGRPPAGEVQVALISPERRRGAWFGSGGLNAGAGETGPATDWPAPCSLPVSISHQNVRPPFTVLSSIAPSCNAFDHRNVVIWKVVILSTFQEMAEVCVARLRVFDDVSFSRDVHFGL